MKNYRPLFYKAMKATPDIDGRKVSGYLAAFGNRDMDGEIITKGAFSKSLNDRGVDAKTPRKIAYLYMHDIRQPLGRFTTLTEDDKGLYFEAEIDNIPLGNQVLEQYASGTLNQHSIGYRYIYDKMEFDSESDTMILKEVELFEGSVVTLGANENTPFTGFKASDMESHFNLIQREMERILKQLSYEQQYELRQLISKYAALIEPPQALIPEPVQKEIDWAKINKLLTKI